MEKANILLKILNAFGKIFGVLTVPLVLINIVGIIVAGIWLAILGKWKLIGGGIAASFISGYGLGMAMMPGLLFVMPAAVFFEKGQRLVAHFFGALSQLYTIVILTVWCMGVLYSFVKQADSSSIVPILLWSYGVAMAPISWLAQKERDNEYTTISTFFAQVAYILVILAILFIKVSLLDVTILFVIVMFVSWIVEYLLALAITLERDKQD